MTIKDTTLTRCPVCDGRKTLLSMGGITRDCKNCAGVGSIKKDVPEEITPVADAVTTKTNKRKK